MPTNIELEKWSEAQEYPIELDAKGRIIDFIDDEKTLENTPEEQIRQKMLQILHFELGYPKKNIGIERTIHMGRDKKRGDIIIYNNPEANASNDQGQIYIIGEVKAPSVKEPDGQLISYLSATSATGGFWTNGSTVYFYKKQVGNKIEDWIGIPKYNETWDTLGRYKKSELIKPIDLKIAFRRCHNAIYRAGIDSEDVALDMVRVILAKIEDESSSAETCSFYITPEEYGDKSGRKKACQRIRNLFNAVKNRFPDVFHSGETISSSDDQLAIVVAYLQQYSFFREMYRVGKTRRGYCRRDG